MTTVTLSVRARTPGLISDHFSTAELLVCLSSARCRLSVDPYAQQRCVGPCSIVMPKRVATEAATTGLSQLCMPSTVATLGAEAATTGSTVSIGDRA